jgi:hypothetical protein
MSTVFSAMALLVMPLWFGMIVMPRARWTAAALRSPVVLAPIALVYVALVVPDLATVLPAVLRPELPQIAELLGTEKGATIAWAHFLAFDAFVGRWVWQDAGQRGISPWVTGPILFAVLMLGPLGLSVYLVVRALRPTTAATSG